MIVLGDVLVRLAIDVVAISALVYGLFYPATGAWTWSWSTRCSTSGCSSP